MSDDPQDQNNSDKPVDQSVSEPENQTSNTPTSTDTQISSETPSHSEISEKARPASEPVTTEEPKKSTKPVEDTERSHAEGGRSRSISASLEKIIEQIEKLSVLELADLVHALEDKFGVSAQVPVAGAAGVTPAGAAEPEEEKTTYNVILSATGANKIAVIKAVRELVPTLGLKEAKDLVEAAPKPVLEGVNKVNAEEAKAKLTAAGGTVELQ